MGALLGGYSTYLNQHSADVNKAISDTVVRRQTQYAQYLASQRTLTQSVYRLIDNLRNLPATYSELDGTMRQFRDAVSRSFDADSNVAIVESLGVMHARQALEEVEDRILNGAYSLADQAINNMPLGPAQLDELSKMLDVATGDLDTFTDAARSDVTAPVVAGLFK